MKSTTMPDEQQAAEHHSSCALIVDADADTRALFHTALALAGWDVVEALDGRDAMTKALTEPPSLIITEWRLPIVDGRALCDILRRDDATRSVPILVVTSEARSNELDLIKRAGANGVFVKPTPPDAVVREARRLVTRAANAPDTSDRTAAPAAPPRTPEPPRSSPRRTALARSHARFSTTTPPLVPPALRCPLCDRAMKYECSHIGGVSARHPEQWDDYNCSTCGMYQYRQRTRRVRRVQ
ncbi:MAG TPA: response regulator [Vicinamibacterales bacterium]|nr:response regulator [Vicinamibacterales bacterium]